LGIGQKGCNQTWLSFLLPTTPSPQPVAPSAKHRLQKKEINTLPLPSLGRAQASPTTPQATRTQRRECGSSGGDPRVPLGKTRAGPGFGLGPKKPKPKMSSPNLTQPYCWAYKSSLNRPDLRNLAQTLPKLRKLQTQARPCPTFELKNQGRVQPKVQVRSGIFGPG
jgi:hypothetical protein